jgi:hypothetical protein
VGPQLKLLVAVVLGPLDELAQAAFGMGPELGPDGVGGVDVQAVQREPAGRAVLVQGQVEQGAHQGVAGDQQIPLRRHVLQLDGVGVVRPGTQLRGGRVDRVREAAEGDLLQAHWRS